MGRNAGREEWELPDFDADPDADATGSHPAGSGGRSGRSAPRARGVLPAVALIALLAAGIAIGGIQEPAPTHDPDSTVAECKFARTDTVPRFELRAPGSESGYQGLVGFTHRPGAETPGNGWVTPAADAGPGLRNLPSGSQIEVHAAGTACIRYVLAEYASATLGHEPGQTERHGLPVSQIDLPSQTPGLGTLPDGDWVVRVTAYFETGVSGPEGLVITEMYFRIRVGSGMTPTPEPKPLVAPVVACGPTPAAADEVEIVMIAPGSKPVPGGVQPGTAAPVVELPVGERASLAVTGDACALRWTIDVVDAKTGQRVDRDSIRNERNDPRWVSQNRWRIDPLIGSYDVIAELNFGPGVDVVRTWRIIGAEFSVPDTFLVADDGVRIRAVPGCGVAFTLANGFSDEGGDPNDPCATGGWGWGDQPTGVSRDELAVLRVRAWSRITLEIPGWTIVNWNGACGQIEPGQDGAEVFRAPECWLGGYNVEGSASPPAPAQFVARPGDLVAELTVTASGSAGRYMARMYARILGR